MSAPSSELALIVTTSTRAYAIPVRHAVEIMRPLAIEPVAGVPSFVRGVAIIRGTPTPVLDLRALAEDGAASETFGRFVTVNAGDHRVALGVDNVLDIRSLDASALGPLPALLRDDSTALIDAIGTCDRQLLLVLRTARLMPDRVWATLAVREAAR